MAFEGPHGAAGRASERAREGPDSPEGSRRAPLDGFLQDELEKLIDTQVRQDICLTRSSRVAQNYLKMFKKLT